jgi:hypothetical protein
LCRGNSPRSRAQADEAGIRFAGPRSMNLSRRGFLGSSLVLLGSQLLEALATPLWRWNYSLLVDAAQPSASASSPVTFVDVAKEAGLNSPNVWGGIDRKRYIIEAKGSGLGFFDYDNDGWLDIYLTNGTHLTRTGPQGRRPLRTFTRTIATAPSPMSQKNPAWAVLAGRRAFALATTTTTAGMICSVASGDTTPCSIITVTELLRT